MGEQVSAEFLNFGVFAQQSLSKEQPSIVGSGASTAILWANIARLRIYRSMRHERVAAQWPVDVAADSARGDLCYRRPVKTYRDRPFIGQRGV
jgi:hypothetical protein